VFSSTCATYGVPERLPIAEDHPQRPVNPYGESKLFVERALAWYEQAHRMRSVALRYFNAAGADPEGDIGEDHDPETHLVPLAIQAALGLRPRLRIFGTDYATPDGTAVRDYVHVSDLAAAHVAALDYLMHGAPSAACNLGTGQGHSVREVVAEVGRVTGRRVPTREAPRRPGDPPMLVASPERGRALLGWRPRHSGLATMVRTACEWHCRAAVDGIPQVSADDSGARPIARARRG
jgi:UDP-glucose-4-epimerase GalE